MSEFLRRLRVAAMLARAAMRDHLYSIEVGTGEEAYTFIGVRVR